MNSAHRPLTWWFAPYLAGTLTVLLLLVIGFGHGRVVDQLELRQHDRFRFHLAQVKAEIETGLRLGFPLTQFPDVQSLLNRAEDLDADIFSVDLFDRHGVIVSTSDEGSLAGRLPAPLSADCQQSDPGLRIGREDNNGWQCVPVTDAIDQGVGGLLLRYRMNMREGLVETVAGQWPMLLGILLTFSLLGSLASWLWLRPLERPYLRVLRDLDSGEAGRGRELPEPIAMAVVKLDQFEASIRVIEKRVDEIDQMDASA